MIASQAPELFQVSAAAQLRAHISSQCPHVSAARAANIELDLGVAYTMEFEPIDLYGARRALDLLALPSEFESVHPDGAINLPLYFMRLKLKSLDRNIHYVVCCDTARRSSAGAYILAERGFQASVLKGGLNALKG